MGPSELHVTELASGRWRVTGGRDPHDVEISGEAARCDCADHRYRRRACRHIRAVREFLLMAPVDLPDDVGLKDEAPPAPEGSGEVTPQADGLLAAIERETLAVLDRCAQKLEQPEARLEAPQPVNVMRKYREARARVAAKQNAS